MEDRPGNSRGQEDGKRSALSAAVQRLCFARWERRPVSELVHEAAPHASSLLGGATNDPVWEPEPGVSTSAPRVTADASPVTSESPWQDAPTAQVPSGRMRRLVGSSAAVVALGVALGAGFVSTGATAGSADPSGTDTTTVPTDTTTAPTDTTTVPTDTTTVPTDTTTVTDPASGDPAGTDPAAGGDPSTTTPAVDPNAGTDTTSTGEPGTTDTTDTTDGPEQPRHGSTFYPKGSKSGAAGTKSQATTPVAAAGGRVGTARKQHAAVKKAPAAPAVTPVDAALLPTPSQIRFYVHAAKVHPLPNLVLIGHHMAVRLVVAGQRHKVGWQTLAAVSKMESGLGRKGGQLAGRRLAPAEFQQYGVDQDRSGTVSTSDGSDALGTLASFLRAHGAGRGAKRSANQKALTAYFGSSSLATRAGALAAFYGALGTGGVQNGLRWETRLLGERVLADHRISIYKGGRSDIRHGRVDARVLLAMEYLARAIGPIKVSTLVSGQRLFTTSGTVSANVYGRAADISAVDGQSIAGHQGPGSVTEKTIRYLLMLPKNVRPRQIISLMDVDGPTGNTGSFALPTQSKNIHIGY
jgi:hypothetical protein